METELEVMEATAETRRPGGFEPLGNSEMADGRWRLAVLVLTCVSYTTASVGSNAVRALQLALRQRLGDAEMGALYGVYNVAAVLMVLVSGRLVDVLGVRLCTLLFAGACVVGYGLQCGGAYLAGVVSFVVLVVGRFAHGAGGESLFVCWDFFLTSWWTGPQTTVAMAWYCGCGRLGDLVVTVLLPPLLGRIGLEQSMLVAMAFVLGSFTTCASLAAIDSSKRVAAKPESGERRTAVMVGLRSFSRGYWIAVGISTTLYGTIGQLIQFLPTLLYMNDLFDQETAALLMAVTYLVAIVGTVSMGLLLSRCLHLRFHLVVGAAVALLLSCVLMLWPHRALALLTLVATGLGYALTSSALWGTLATYSDGANVGLLYSVPYAAYNLSSFLISVASGILLEKAPPWVAVAMWTAISCLGAALSVMWVFDARAAAAKAAAVSEVLTD